MADYSEPLGLHRERMARRIGFLEDRAIWHQRRETPLDVACAATLRRDAGLVALLLGDADEARTLLGRAGEALVAVGIFSGYLLQSLAGPSRLRDSADPGMMTRFARAASGAGDDELTRPFERASRQSPRQQLDLFQALRGRRTRDFRDAAGAASERLAVNAAMTVGLSRMPVATYVPLFERFGADEPAGDDRDTLFAAAVTRRQLIEAGRFDDYHWRMLLKPAELVDLDMVALGMNAIEAGRRAEGALLETAERLGPVAALPFLLARDLAGPPLEEPRPRYRER